MSVIKVHDKLFQPFLSKDKIGERIASLAAEIDRDYAGLTPLAISVLNGSFIFAADLFRALTIDAEISFVKLSSYEGTVTTGKVVTTIGLQEDIHSRHVLIIEDIIDTGNTLAAFIPTLLEQQPASLKIAAFISKPDARQHPIHADYLGFEIRDKFVIGYGLDYNGLGRYLPELYELVEEG